MRRHEFGATGSHNFITAVLDNSQFPRVEDQTDVGMIKIKLFVSSANPWNLTISWMQTLVQTSLSLQDAKSPTNNVSAVEAVMKQSW